MLVMDSVRFEAILGCVTALLDSSHFAFFVCVSIFPELKRTLLFICIGTKQVKRKQIWYFLVPIDLQSSRQGFCSINSYRLFLSTLLLFCLPIIIDWSKLKSVFTQCILYAQPIRLNSDTELFIYSYTVYMWNVKY